MTGKSGRFVKNVASLERANYLYQLATLVAPKDPLLAASYLNTMKAVAKKAVLRCEPSIKRKICKNCDTLLVPGHTQKIKYNKEGGGNVVKICTICGHQRRFQTRKDYKIWTEKSEAVIHYN